jgi:mannose-6-phosphate isomerase-like protein (cupin superfamily)
MENQGAQENKKLGVDIIIEIIEYVPKEALKRTVMKKTKRNITVSSLVIGEDLGFRLFSVDTFLQIIEGTARVSIHGKIYELRLGEGVIIPANTEHLLFSTGNFKVISTSVKGE